MYIETEADRIASLNLDNIEEFDQGYEDKIQKWKDENPNEINIICVICKDRVGYFIPRYTDIPLRGRMIHRHVGTETWPMPGPDDGPKYFFCPHGLGPEGDGHMFVTVDERDPDSCNTFLTDKNEPYQITKGRGACPCGCGGVLRGKNKYAQGLVCYKKHMAKLKPEK
jgi:hypothetical protein